MHRLLWLLLGASSFAMLSHLHSRGNWPTIPSGQFKLLDIAMIWAAALRVLSGDATLVYNHSLHDAFQSALLHQPTPGLSFPYPPHALLLFAPLGLLSYGQAWLAMLLPGIALYFVILRRIANDGLAASGMTFALGGATHAITLGQSGFYTASLLTGGLLLLPRSKVAAGVMFGLLTFKPHLGIVLAFALLLWREWRAIAAATCTASLLMVAATLIFGPSIWSAFGLGNAGFVAELAQMQEGVIRLKMQSTFALAIPGVGTVGAAFAQVISAGMALGMIARISHLTDDWLIRSAAVIAGTLLVSPYLFLYDATMLTAAAALLLRDAPKRECIAIFFALLIPGTWYLQLRSSVPFAALIVLGIAYLRAASRDAPRHYGIEDGVQGY